MQHDNAERDIIRRRMQFNLRTLMLLLVLLAGPLAAVGNKWYESYQQKVRLRENLLRISISFDRFSPSPSLSTLPDWPNEGQPQAIEE